MKVGSIFVRDSSDAVAFELCEPSDDNMSNFDKISSHLVECKCRSGSGVDGSLHKAERIQEKVAEMKGGSAFADTAAGKAVYLRVSSGEESRLAELIPSKSERIRSWPRGKTNALT